MKNWMNDAAWLRERRAAILHRMQLEGTERDPDSFDRSGARGARRDALVVITRRLLEINGGVSPGVPG